MTFEQQQADHREITTIGDALAQSDWSRGERLNQDERAALQHWSRWGSEGYPVRKIGAYGWMIESPTVKHCTVHRTKRAAVRSWEILIAKWIRMSGLEAQLRARREYHLCELCGDTTGEGNAICQGCAESR